MTDISKPMRPDRLLQKRLIALSYSLVALTLSLMLSVFFPEMFTWFLIALTAITIYCLILSIRALKAGEKAITYGGFANELVRLSNQAERIENSKGRIILENDAAKELFRGAGIIDFLQINLSDYRNNHTSLQRLKNACLNLIPEHIFLSLNLNGQTWLEISFRPIYLKKTDIFETPFSLKKVKKDIYMYWSFQDITAKHNMEQVLKSELEAGHNFLDHLPAGLYITDKNHIIKYCNHAFAASIGLDREKIAGTGLKEHLSKNSEIPPHNKPWSGKIYLANGTETFIKQDSYREDDEIMLRVAAITGLPNDKLLHSELSRAVDEISWLFDFAPIGIIFTDLDGNIKEHNRKADEFLQITDNKSFIELVKSSDQNTLKREFDYIKSGIKELTSLDTSVQEKAAIIYVTPMKKLHNNTLDGFVIYLIDAREQKNLEVQFAQAQKMQAMGQLAGGVAHDFNNLLTAIIGFCDLLLQRHGIGDPSFADLIQIKNNANRAAGLVRQLLAFSRKQPLLPKLIDVTENFMELSQMLKRVLGEKITLEFHHGANLGYIKVDPVQFSQVIINLAVNAKDAMTNGGVLTISTKTETVVSSEHIGEDKIKPGKYVLIEVKDTGCGIPPKNINRIFEPFFSTKQNVVGSGTGLGLAMVYGIVRQTGGFITVESKIDIGTGFSIHLPFFENNEAEEQSAPENKSTPTAITIKAQNPANIAIDQKFIFGLNVSSIDKGIEAASGGGIKILFVEDEDSVRSFAMRALKKKGYEVVGCNSAENALEKLKQETGFDLLITDMVMPGINGIELANRVTKKIKDIKVIIASGYSEEIARNEHLASPEFAFLAKPFSLGDLSKKILDVLEK